MQVAHVGPFLASLFWQTVVVGITFLIIVVKYNNDEKNLAHINNLFGPMYRLVLSLHCSTLGSARPMTSTG
jgi:hypothetical protein